MRIPIGQFIPDIAPIAAAQGLLRALNAVPTSAGYDSLPSLKTVSGATAIDNYARGAISGIDLAGNAFNFVGDESKLYHILETGQADISKASGYSSTGETRWEFSLHGDVVFATNYNDEMQYFDIRSSTVFDDVKNTANAPAVPRAKHMATFDNFLFTGNIYDPVDGPLANAVSWSGVNAPFAWPERGTELAVSLLSDKQVLEGKGGPINAVIAGSEVGSVFQKDAIWRADFVGGDVVFALRRVEPDHGLFSPGLATAIGREVFFLSEDGFRMFNYTSSRSVGKDRVNKFFFNDLNQTYVDRISIERDPDDTLVYILYTGSGADATGTPNKLLIYDYLLDVFSHGEVEAEVMVKSITPTATLDSAGTASDPDDLVSTTDSFDDRITATGSRNLGAYNGSHVLSSFNGPALTAIFETGHLEVIPGSRSMVKDVRPLIDAEDVVMQIASTGNRKEKMVFGPEKPLTRSGVCKLRKDGRYHQLRLTARGGFQSALAFDIDALPTGGR